LISTSTGWDSVRIESYSLEAHRTLAEVINPDILTLSIVFTGGARTGLSDLTSLSIKVIVTDAVGHVVSKTLAVSLYAFNPIELTRVPVLTISA
jgi:hypothetical protein